jgi:hypothetical protein
MQPSYSHRASARNPQNIELSGAPSGKFSKRQTRPATDRQLAQILMGSPMDIPMQSPVPSARTAGRAAFQAGRLSDVLNNQP